MSLRHSGPLTAELAADLLRQQGFKRKGKTFYRLKNDLYQLINFQRSNWSDLVYVNVAFWPTVLGEPEHHREHLWPIRGRIGPILKKKISDEESSTLIPELICALGGALNSFAGVAEIYRQGCWRDHG